MNRGAAIIALGLLATSPAFADGFRCGSHLITTSSGSTTRSEVAAKCGEPTEVVTMRSVFRRPVIWTNGRPFFVGEDAVEIPVESWIYNLGPNKLMRRLRFEGGILTEIETLGYGFIK